MRNLELKRSVVFSIAFALILVPAVRADVTSPSIKDKGHKYTTEKARTDYYGTGGSGRLVEASELRILVDDLLASGEFEKAIPKARKAVQLDPGDPSGHLFLARALTNKLYQSKGEVDEKLLAECIREWQIIRYHDADPTEQWEAGNNVKKLQKIAKALEKEKRLKEEKEKEKEDSELAKKDSDKSDTSSAGKVAEKKDATKASAATEKRQIAERKKRWGIF